MAQRKSNLPDGEYTSKKTGGKVVVKNGVATDVKSMQMVERMQMADPQELANRFGKQVVGVVAGTPVGAALAAGNAGSMGLNARALQGIGSLVGATPQEQELGKELYKQADAKNPAASTAGSAASGLVTALVPGGSWVRGALNVAGAANHADTVGASPGVAGGVAAALSAASGALGAKGKFMGGVAELLEEKFGPRAAQMIVPKQPRVPPLRTSPITQEIPRARGPIERATMRTPEVTNAGGMPSGAVAPPRAPVAPQAPTVPPQYKIPPRMEDLGGGMMQPKGYAAGLGRAAADKARSTEAWAGSAATAVGASAIPLSESVNRAKRMEDERYRALLRKINFGE